MASSSNITKYPPRLYKEGKSLLQNRSMNHNCFLNKIGTMKLELGEDVWTKLRESSLGVFIKLTEEPYTWTAQPVHYFLTHQLAVKNIHEIWSLIDGMPIRFSLNEFEDITKLKCNPIDEADNWDANHHDFWNKMGVPISDGPTYKELEKVMACCKTFSPEERMMVGRLCLLSVGIYGIHHASRVPLSSAKRVLDPDAFEKHPWGRVVYESVPGLGESFGKRRSTLTGYPLLDWESSRKRINFEDFIKKEKTAYKKVRVRHMVDVSEENMYPNWSDTDEENDTELDNLIKDIIHKRLPANVWEGEDAVCVKRNKRKVEEKVHRQRGRIQKKEKMKEDYSTDEEEEKVSNKKYKMGEEHSEDVKAKEKSMFDILNMLETMNGTISDLDKNIRGRMDALETRFESLVNEKATFLDAQLSKRIDTLQKDLKDMKESKPGVVHNDDGHSKNNLDDEADSQALSWMVEEKQTSKDEFPVQRVVRKVYTVKNKKKKEGEISEDLFLFEKKDATNDHKKKIDSKTSKKGGIKDGKKPVTVKIVKKDSPQLNKKKKRADVNGDDIEDITDQVVEANQKMASSSEGAWSDPRHQMLTTALDAAVTGFGTMLNKLDGGPNMARRVPQLAESQKFPYVGNSTVRRIITDAVPSSGIPGHLEPADDAKLQRLLDFLNLDAETPYENNNPAMTFYWQIMTPRENWPTATYGWLKGYHMAAAMQMFRKRLVRDPSHYRKDRITFLDQDMVTELVKDFNQFKLSQKNFLFRQFYVDCFNGTLPSDSPTNKKWYIDIDHLYACLFVNKNHWVALDVNLLSKKIFVYDSFPSMMSDKDIVEACQPFRRMIPALLSQTIPENIRKKSFAMLEVRRVSKNVPVNENPGDCGIFALKYIECLALGKTFDGICDRNMPAIRTKLATELFDEVGKPDTPDTSDTMSDTLSRGKASAFRIPHLTDSP